jgi:hypothetical protein
MIEVPIYDVTLTKLHDRSIYIYLFIYLFIYYIT